MGAFYLLPLSSLKMHTEQKQAAVELLLFFIRSGSELLLRRRHIKILRMNASERPLLPWSLFPRVMGQSLSQRWVGGAGACHVLAAEGSTKTDLWSCLISSLRELQQWCVAEVRRVGVRCGAGGLIYKRSLLPVFYPCLSLSLFVKAWLVD